VRILLQALQSDANPLHSRRQSPTQRLPHLAGANTPDSLNTTWLVSKTAHRPSNAPILTTIYIQYCISPKDYCILTSTCCPVGVFRNDLSMGSGGGVSCGGWLRRAPVGVIRGWMRE
jgi:hypothetical protein